MRHRDHAIRLAVAAFIAVPGMRGERGNVGTPTGTMLTARHLSAGASVKVFNPTGAVRLVGWSHDSLEVRGVVSPSSRYFADGDSSGVKVGVDDASPGEPPTRGDLTIYLPRGAQVAVKTVNGNVDASDVSGWFYTIGGTVRISGSASSIDVEAMKGDVELRAAVPWLRARAGSGHVVIDGAAQDVDVSTISGALDVATGQIVRGQFASVSGDIRCTGALAAGAIFDVSNHSGNVDLALPRASVGTFTLSTIDGSILNGFAAPVRPASQPERTIRFALGHGGADVTVRTFKGAIRVQPH